MILLIANIIDIIVMSIVITIGFINCINSIIY